MLFFDFLYENLFIELFIGFLMKYWFGAGQMKRDIEIGFQKNQHSKSISKNFLIEFFKAFFERRKFMQP